MKLFARLFMNFASVAKHEGILLDEEEIVNHVKSTFDPHGIGHHYPSMYQD